MKLTVSRISRIVRVENTADGNQRYDIRFTTDTGTATYGIYYTNKILKEYDSIPLELSNDYFIIGYKERPSSNKPIIKIIVSNDTAKIEK
jgi:hypothetical protein